MSIKSKVLAGAAALTMATGVGALATGTAHAATPSCADNCVDIFSHAFGSHTRPNFLLDVLRQGQKSGQPVILYRTSNNDPAEDFQPENAGLVSDFVNAGLISKSVGLHYGGTACRDGYPITGTPGGGILPQPCSSSDPSNKYYPDLAAFEIEYSPYGAGSGLCVGTASMNGTGKVTLEPCGVSARTVWIVDTTDSSTINRDGGVQFSEALEHGYAPLINGAQTNFSHPYVLTYPQNGYPTDMPRPQLMTQQLSLTSAGDLSNLQLWGYNTGVVHS